MAALEKTNQEMLFDMAWVHMEKAKKCPWVEYSSFKSLRQMKSLNEAVRSAFLLMFYVEHGLK